MPSNRAYLHSRTLFPRRPSKSGDSRDLSARANPLVGAELAMSIEIDARLPGGASEQVVRTVTEHGRTLKFEPGSGGERDCRVTPEGQPPKRGRAPGRDDSPASGDARNTTDRCEGWPHPASPPRWPLPSPPRGTPDRPAGRACSSPLRRGMSRRGRGAVCCGLRCLPSATSSASSAQPC